MFFFMIPKKSRLEVDVMKPLLSLQLYLTSQMLLIRFHMKWNPIGDY